MRVFVCSGFSAVVALLALNVCRNDQTDVHQDDFSSGGGALYQGGRECDAQAVRTSEQK